MHVAISMIIIFYDIENYLNEMKHVMHFSINEVQILRNYMKSRRR